MKNKSLITMVALLAVLICLTLALLLFYAVKPSFLIVLAFFVGLLTGIFITAIIYNLINNFKNKGSKRKQ